MSLGKAYKNQFVVVVLRFYIFMKSAYIFILFLFILIHSVLINEFNNNVIRKSVSTNKNSSSLIFNSSVSSVDNYWYTNQIKNYVAGKGFTINPNDEHSFVRRTPVYPMFYGIHYLLFGEAGSYFFIRFTQVFLFAIAAIALLYGAFNFTNNKMIAIISACLFGFNPTLVAYLYYTITEALSPALVCFIIYYLSRCYKYNCKKDWLFAGFFFVIGILCRPAIIFLSPAILFLLLFKNKSELKSLINPSIFFITGASILMIPHVVRNYINTKEIVLLEKYYGDPMDYGMSNIALRHWIACWINPADYASEIVSNNMINNIIEKKSEKRVFLQTELNRLPVAAFQNNSKEKIEIAYNNLYNYYLAKMKQQPVVIIDSLSKISSASFEELKTTYIKNAPFSYYVITPLLFLKSVIFQSNSGQSFYLQDYQNNKIIFALKTLMYLLNVFLFASLFIGFFYRKKYGAIYFSTIIYVVSTCIYVMFILHYFEARYLIPLFPFMYIIGAIVMVETVGKLKQKIAYISK